MKKLGILLALALILTVSIAYAQKVIDAVSPAADAPAVEDALEADVDALAPLPEIEEPVLGALDIEDEVLDAEAADAADVVTAVVPAADPIDVEEVAEPVVEDVLAVADEADDAADVVTAVVPAADPIDVEEVAETVVVETPDVDAVVVVEDDDEASAVETPAPVAETPVAEAEDATPAVEKVVDAENVAPCAPACATVPAAPTCAQAPARVAIKRPCVVKKVVDRVTRPIAKLGRRGR